MISGANIAGKRCKVVIGVNARPDEVYAFLLKMPRLTSHLKIGRGDEGAHRFRLSCARNYNPEADFCFDVSITSEGNLCDIHIKPENTEDSKGLSNVVASMIEAMSLHGGIRIIEVKDYTQDGQEPPTDEDIEGVSSYLQEHVLADLEQISSDLGMKPLIVSISLHRLINNGIIGCTPIGTGPTKLFYYK